MLFNSYEFLFAFLPAVWLLFFGSARLSPRLALLVLTLASLLFYGWWNPRLLWLLLASAAGNFVLGRSLARLSAIPGRDRQAGSLLVVAVTLNLLLLGWFKYTNFLLDTANSLLSTTWHLHDIVLPLGISFFTFTQIAYLVDSRRGLAREADPLRYLLFVTYFPHLIAGPVIHHQQMMPQFADPATFLPRRAAVVSGLSLFAIGLFKKVIIADHLALVAGPVFDGAGSGQLAPAQAWVGAIAYTLQLYFDFSGYCDMAMGLSRLFNVELPLNFNSPYQARNLIDFWRRWHITLSHFLRDYLYFALGGNRRGPARRYMNLFTTMVLGGLWHGASWTFVCWGALHGAGLIVNHGWRSLLERWSVPDPFRVPGLGRALTFVFVVFTWVPFRASDLRTTGRIWSAMVSPVGWQTTLLDGHVVAWLALCLGMVWWLPNAVAWVDRSPNATTRMSWRPTAAWGAAMGLMLGVAVAFFARNSPFLYYQF
jgi:alginate O-acetyltransferase complex protein AlgI